MNLEKYKRKRERPILCLIWYVTKSLFFANYFFPFSRIKIVLLELFGAKIGKNVIIKPNVNIKYPWKLKIGNNVWLGEKVWIDNLAPVRVGNNVCISQGAYLCTGNHNYKKESFDLITEPIIIEDEVWICAFARIAPGIRIKKGTVVGFGSVLKEDTQKGRIYYGNPAKIVKERK